MKKLLVLTLVLGMATLASAGLEFSVNGTTVADGGSIDIPMGTAFTVEVVNNAVTAIPYAMGGISADLSYAAVNGDATIDVGDVMPGDWIIYEFGMDPEPYFYWIIENTVAGVGDTQAATLLTISLNCTAAPGDVVIELWDTSFAQTLASVTIHQIVPEPATMLLLGLGGLFLRRK